MSILFPPHPRHRHSAVPNTVRRLTKRPLCPNVSAAHLKRPPTETHPGTTHTLSHHAHNHMALHLWRPESSQATPGPSPHAAAPRHAPCGPASAASTGARASGSPARRFAVEQVLRVFAEDAPERRVVAVARDPLVDLLGANGIDGSCIARARERPLGSLIEHLMREVLSGHQVTRKPPRPIRGASSALS